MKIIIVGCGKFGTRLANYLNNQNHDVTIIDNREEAFNNLGGNFTGRTVLGMGYDKDVLEVMLLMLLLVILLIIFTMLIM